MSQPHCEECRKKDQQIAILVNSLESMSAINNDLQRKYFEVLQHQGAIAVLAAVIVKNAQERNS